MKTILLSAIFFLFLLQPITAQKSVNNLFEDMKDDEKSFALKLPGWIIDAGLKYALSDEDNETLNLFKDKIKKMRVLVNENPTIDFKKAIAKFKNNFSNDHLELYASVKDKSNLVNVYVEESKDKINNLFFLINGDNTVVLLHLKTDIALADFEKANFTFNKKTKKDEKN